MSSKSEEAQGTIIDGLKITPEIIKALREIKENEGPKVKDFFTEQCLLIALIEFEDVVGIDRELFRIFLQFHRLLTALFNEEGGSHEEN